MVAAIEKKKKSALKKVVSLSLSDMFVQVKGDEIIFFSIFKIFQAVMGEQKIVLCNF